MKNLFKDQKVYVVLDQFATSGMFDDPVQPIWEEIRNLLEVGIKNGSLACPIPAEHFIETASKSEERAIILNDKFMKLSEGFIMRPEPDVTSQLLISRIRNNNITKNTFLQEQKTSSLIDFKKSINSLQTTRSTFDSQIKEATILSRIISEEGRERKLDDETRDLLFQTHKSLNVTKMLDRLKDARRDKKIIVSGVEFSTVAIPYWIDVIIFRLLEKHRITIKELNFLIAHLEKYGFNLIPTLDIRTTLTAGLAVNYKAEIPSDHIDISRLATGLPFADIILTDKKRKNELVTLGLSKKYSAQIFCGTESDLKGLTQVLKQTVDTSN